jgi:hypothetical protein
VTKKLEAVDFYSGHKETLAYLGTIWVDDGSPEGIQARQRFTDESLSENELYVEADYLAAVDQLKETNEADDVFPHAYRNSIGTPWSYRYQAGTVLVYQGGYLTQTYLCNGGRNVYEYFPNLGGKKVNA